MVCNVDVCRWVHGFSPALDEEGAKYAAAVSLGASNRISGDRAIEEIETSQAAWAITKNTKNIFREIAANVISLPVTHLEPACGGI